MVGDEGLGRFQRPLNFTIGNIVAIGRFPCGPKTFGPHLLPRELGRSSRTECPPNKKYPFGYSLFGGR